MNPLIQKYLRSEYAQGKRRTIFCPGCGNGIILGYFIRAIDELKREGKFDDSKLYIVTGIGCSGNIPVPLKYNIVRALHGRALSVATGIKLVKPDSEVVVFAGDGDLLSIGGNHLIHTIRRNVGIKVILVNNMLYGMTGGQVAPTTPMDAITHTTPYGNPEPPLDACRLAVSLGATYVARWAVPLARQCIQSIKELLLHRGFGLLECLSQCPVYQGRYVIGIDRPSKIMDYFLRITVVSNEPRYGDKITIGKFVDYEKPTYEEIMWSIMSKAREGGGYEA